MYTVVPVTGSNLASMTCHLEVDLKNLDSWFCKKEKKKEKA